MSEPSIPHPSEIADAGLQSERTYLAWQRTGLSFAVLGALLFHTGGDIPHSLAKVPGLLGLGVGAVILVRGMLRYRLAASAARGERPTAAGGVIALVAATSTLLAIAALVVILLLPY